MWQEQVIILVGLAGSLFLLGAAAFFSASETALVSLSPQKAKRLALKNPDLTNALLGWIGKPHELLTLILIGNTFAHVLFATAVTAIAVHLLVHVSPSLVEWSMWGLETAAVVVLGDMLPKFFARANPEKTSLLVLPWLSRMRMIFRPFYPLFFMFRLFFPRTKTHSSVSQGLAFSLDEFKLLLQEGKPSGTVSADSVGMMQRVLDIRNQTAENIMTPMEKVDFIEINPEGKPVRDRELLLDLVVENGHTRTPVKWNGHIIGFVHTDDLLPLIMQDPEKDTTKMVRRADDVPANRPVSELLRDFRKSGNYMGFVSNEQNEIIGIVTLEDILEEITGEILDEYDVRPSCAEATS